MNRKNISHIVLENRPEYFRVTLIVSDRFPYNYKAVSYPLYIPVASASEALSKARELDKYLDCGYNMKVILNGSEIIDYQLDPKIE